MPTSGDQLMEYVRLGLKLLLCCACFGPHCCCFEGLIAREDAKVPPPRLESPAASVHAGALHAHAGVHGVHGTVYTGKYAGGLAPAPAQ